jgi:hypothetical protein
MKVYIVQRGLDYENNDILAIYRTRKKAEEMCEKEHAKGLRWSDRYKEWRRGMESISITGYQVEE